MKNCTSLILAVFLFCQLFAQPVITSFTPASGTVGTTVTINGTGFSAIAADNTVYFGGMKAVVETASTTSLQVTAPAGATNQPITVTTNYLTAYAVTSFSILFSGGGLPLTTNSFLPKSDLVSGIYPHALSVADFNNDGKNDLVVCKGSANTVSVFSNSSTPGAISFSKTEFNATGNNHEASATGDLDGDGKQDFVITNSFGNNSISIYRNNSSGAIISFAAAVDYPADNGPYSIAIGDIDGDGKPDIAIANGGGTRSTFTGIPVYPELSLSRQNLISQLARIPILLRSMILTGMANRN